MRFPLILALLITPAAVLAQPAAVPDWKPFHVFIGTWEGTRSSPSGAGVKVVRTYETGEGSHQLDVTEGSGKSRAPWGTVHYDQGKSAFVLDQNKATDDPFELVLNHVSEDGSELTFVASPDGSGQVERITHRLGGWNDFVEIVESAPDGKQFSLISETHFHRK
ncbi:MAG TPA: hypothetical protein VKF80_01910 [Candidatus Eisenbacteria bacterium]|nr:hypothetical protein [Candidatus Eisenbacteria bacterium]